VVEQALAAGHTVTALVRSSDKLTTSHARLRVVEGEATETSAVSSVLEGADAIISTLGGTGSVIADSTRAIVAAAGKTGVTRVVVLSTFAAQRDRLGAGTRLLTGLGMGAMLKDKTAGEEMLRRSDLEWTIVYASILSDGPASGSVAVLPQGSRRGLSQKISRADVAAWMVQTATGTQHSRSGVGITG
jgi:putative NADH-flavin reductase